VTRSTASPRAVSISGHLRRGAQAAKQFKAVEAGQHDIEHNHETVALERALEAGIAIVAHFDLETFGLEVFFEHLGHLGVVIDDQDGGGLHDSMMAGASELRSDTYKETCGPGGKRYGIFAARAPASATGSPLCTA
jgi:hypothetical protein